MRRRGAAGPRHGDIAAPPPSRLRLAMNTPPRLRSEPGMIRRSSRGETGRALVRRAQ